MTLKPTLRWTTALCGAAMILPALVPGGAPAAHARDKDKDRDQTPDVVVELWPGRRPLMLLPLQTGPAWNLDQSISQSLLPAADDILSTALETTEKFSVLRPHRFNPVLQRALLKSENLITEEQIKALNDDPTLDNARLVLSRLSFDQDPLIAQFALEQVRAGGDMKQPTVQVQVSGQLYELNQPNATRRIVLTTDSVGGGKSDVDRIIKAAYMGFKQLAAEFVRPPSQFQLRRGGAPMRPGMSMNGMGARPGVTRPLATGKATGMGTDVGNAGTGATGAPGTGTTGTGTPGTPDDAGVPPLVTPGGTGDSAAPGGGPSAPDVPPPAGGAAPASGAAPAAPAPADGAAAPPAAEAPTTPPQ